MTRLSAGALLQAGFLRLTCEEPLELECGNCGTPLQVGDGVCLVCGPSGLPRAKCGRCQQVVSGTAAGKRACLSVRAYENDPTRGAAFAPDEGLWEIAARGGDPPQVLRDAELRRRVATGALGAEVLIRAAGSDVPFRSVLEVLRTPDRSAPERPPPVPPPPPRPRPRPRPAPSPRPDPPPPPPAPRPRRDEREVVKPWMKYGAITIAAVIGLSVATSYLFPTKDRPASETVVAPAEEKKSQADTERLERLQRDQAQQAEVLRRAAEQKQRDHERLTKEENEKQEARKKHRVEESSLRASEAVDSNNIGPSFDCASSAVANQKLAQIICAERRLSWMDLSYVNAYQALRAVMSSSLRQSLVDEADTFVRALTDECGIPAVRDARHPTDEVVSCIIDHYRRQIANISSRLPPMAREELLLTPSQVLEVQTLLVRNGLLPPAGAIDGVIGPATRAAISEWQRQVGHEATGFASVSLLEQLRAPISESTPPTESARPTSLFKLTFCNRTGEPAYISVAGQRVPGNPEFRIEGWWQLEPGQCGALGEWVQDVIYWFAVSDNRKWEGTASYCVSRSQFIRINEANYYCNASEQLEYFSEVVVQAAQKVVYLDPL
jgi:uncharacterized membrane protein